MGNVIKVLVRDLESVNFDKICRLALELAYVRKLDTDDLTVVGSGEHDADIDGEPVDREYWKVGGRSMTETYAKRVDFHGPLPGLDRLCDLLARNHGKVPGIDGGFLYKPGKIPNFARNLAIMPDRASEIVGRLVKEVADALAAAELVHTFSAASGEEWDELEEAFAEAERGIFDQARVIGRELESGRCKDGESFPLANWSGQNRPLGIVLRTRSPNLMKHLWGLLQGPGFQVAVAILRNPDTGRLAVLSSNKHRVDVGPVVKALTERFPKTELDVNLQCGRIIWDPRSGTEDPTVEVMRELIAAHLAPRRDQPQQHKPQPRLGVTLADTIRQAKPETRARKRR